MKRYLLSITFAFISFSVIAQKAQFGLTAGYTNINLKVKAIDGSNSFNISEDQSGFYVGVLADMATSEKFHVQPGALFALANDTKFLYIPVLAKLYLGESKFHVLVGPQATVVLEETNGLKNLGFDLTFGAGFDINTHFFLDARYAFGLTNRQTENRISSIDYKQHLNTFNVGLGYKF